MPFFLCLQYGRSRLLTVGTENEKGTGLGLMLIKNYIEENAGEFMIESNENKGTNVKVKLPMEPPL